MSSTLIQNYDIDALLIAFYDNDQERMLMLIKKMKAEAVKALGSEESWLKDIEFITDGDVARLLNEEYEANLLESVQY